MMFCIDTYSKDPFKCIVDGTEYQKSDVSFVFVFMFFLHIQLCRMAAMAC